MDDGKAVGVVSLGFSKTFATIFHSIRGLDSFTVHCIKNCIVVVNEVTSSCQPGTSGVPQGSILGPAVLHIFLNDQEEKIKYILRQLAKDTKLGRCVDLLEGRKALKSNLKRLNQWDEANWMRFNKVNTRSCTWVITITCTASDLRKNGWKSCLAEKDLWVLVIASWTQDSSLPRWPRVPMTSWIVSEIMWVLI